MRVAKCRLRLGRACILHLLHCTDTDDDLLMQILTWALVTLTTVLEISFGRPARSGLDSPSL